MTLQHAQSLPYLTPDDLEVLADLSHGIAYLAAHIQDSEESLEFDWPHAPVEKALANVRDMFVSDDEMPFNAQNTREQTLNLYAVYPTNDDTSREGWTYHIGTIGEVWTRQGPRYRGDLLLIALLSGPDTQFGSIRLPPPPSDLEPTTAISTNKDDAVYIVWHSVPQPDPETPDLQMITIPHPAQVRCKYSNDQWSQYLRQHLSNEFIGTLRDLQHDGLPPDPVANPENPGATTD